MDYRKAVEALHASAKALVGEDVLYRAPGHADVTLQGIFRDAHQATNQDLTAEVASEHPTVDLLEEDLPAGIAPDDRLRVRGTWYGPTEPIPDGEGMVKVGLIEDPDTTS